MKKKLAVILMMALFLTSCSNLKTKDKAQGENSGGEKVEINLLSMSSNEDDANIVRDQLVKNGFDVKINIQPEYSSFKEQQDAGNYDIAISAWTTVTGNPDYAVRSLFTSTGDYKLVEDKKIDDLVNEASTVTEEEQKEKYKAFEDYVITEKAYIAPLYASQRNLAYQKEILNGDTIHLAQSRSLPWENLSYNDQSQNETRPLVQAQSMSELTSLDPIKGNDGSINQINSNLYVRLVNLTTEDGITADGSLSYNYAIADGNSEYYFILKDNINFAKIENDTAVDSGERVGIDDVIFSLERAKNKDSVPDHRTYTLHEHIDTVEAITDLGELENKKLSTGDETVKDALEKDLDVKISELVSDKNKADSSAGKYQVIKVTTPRPFPQVLNYLAHQSAGIVSKQQVEKINTYDVESFNIETDIPYGDERTVTENNEYGNSLYCSGPYALITKNDYEVVFQKNPAYQIGTENEAKITNMKTRFIKDEDSTISALRSGELDFFYGLTQEDKREVIEETKELDLISIKSNVVSYLQFNNFTGKISENEGLRKAILYSINQDDFISFYKGQKLKVYSTVTTMVDTGNELKADPEKAKEHLNKYLSK